MSKFDFAPPRCTLPNLGQLIASNIITTYIYLSRSCTSENIEYGQYGSSR